MPEEILHVTLSGFNLNTTYSIIILPFQGFKSRRDVIVVEKNAVNQNPER